MIWVVRTSVMSIPCSVVLYQLYRPFVDSVHYWNKSQIQANKDEIHFETSLWNWSYLYSLPIQKHQYTRNLAKNVSAENTQRMDCHCQNFPLITIELVEGNRREINWRKITESDWTMVPYEDGVIVRRLSRLIYWLP